MNTLPYNKNWLKLNFDYLIKNKLDGVTGKTIYLANNFVEKIIRASTYGKAGLLQYQDLFLLKSNNESWKI